MTKKIALAVLASSLLFACGPGEKDPECILDEAAACAGKQCGSVSVKDSCGESHNLTCGSCTGDDETCQNNMCVSSTGPTCEVSEEKKAERAAEKAMEKAAAEPVAAEDSHVCEPRFCPNCGAQVRTDAEFCQSCGTKL